MILIKNKMYELKIDDENGKIISLKKDNKNLLSKNQPPLFRVRFRDDKGKAILFGPSEGRLVQALCNNNQHILTYSGFQETALTVTVFIRFVADSPFTFWNVKVECDTLQLEWFEFPGVAVTDTFQDNYGNSKILWPYNEGVVIDNITTRENSALPYREPEYPSSGSYAIYPGMISTPFLAVMSDNGGLYYGAHDTHHNTKGVDFFRQDGGIKLQIRLFPGTDKPIYETEYDTVLGVFDGDWYAAAEIYRSWFEINKPKNFKSITENEKLPYWYGESPVVITYCVRGKFDTDVMDPNRLFPYVNGLPVIENYAEKLNSKILVLLMHWEGSAPWAPPYVWPPYGGEEKLREYIDALHKKGHLLGVYCSGLGWTQTSNLVNYKTDKVFREKHLERVMCISPEGELPRSRICNAQRFGYDLCPSQDFCKETLVNEVNAMSRAGIDYVQLLDQNHGGTPYMCYSKVHGHPPVPGKWESEALVDIMHAIEKQIGDNKMLFGCESAAAEVFIPELLLSDNRYEVNYMIGMPVPLYSYLYHSYVNNFMGNQVCGEGVMAGCQTKNNLLYRLAYSFVAGDFLTIVINDNGDIQWAWGQSNFDAGYMPDRKTVTELVRNMNGWRTGIAKKYLHSGKMIHPLDITETESQDLLTASGVKRISKVLTSHFEAADGSRGQIVVNYTNDLVRTKISGIVGMKKYIDFSSNAFETITSEYIDILPLSAALMEES